MDYNRKFTIHYYRNGQSTYTIAENCISALHKLLKLFDDVEVKDVRLFEHQDIDMTFE